MSDLRRHVSADLGVCSVHTYADAGRLVRTFTYPVELFFFFLECLE